MTTHLYYDTSALVKEFVSEIGSDLIDKIGAVAVNKQVQVITSVWSINETIAVIDRLSRRPRNPLTKIEKQEIMATLAQRIKNSSERAAFKFAPMEHRIIANSRILIDQLHVSPDDAVHLYTAFIFDCQYFLVHDDKIVSKLKDDPIEGMKVIDLGSEGDRNMLAGQLGL